MQVLIAHDHPFEAMEMQGRLCLVSHFSFLPLAHNLTEAFNAAEHSLPDIILIHHRLTQKPEFELMRSLLRALKILCVLFSPTGPKQTKLSQFAIDLPIVAQDISGDALTAKLQRALVRVHNGTKRPTTICSTRSTFDQNSMILIGASTGGVDAITKVLSNFTSYCPPTFVVQHTGGGFSQSLIRLLDRGCAAKVTEAMDGDRPESGHIYVAGGDFAHMTFRQSKTPQIQLRDDPKQSGHRPSIDALFESAVGHASCVSAALLTGMGRDGAEGLLSLRRAGSRTFGQDEATSVVYGMPRVAYEMGAVEKQLPIEKIGPALLRSVTIEG